MKFTYPVLVALTLFSCSSDDIIKPVTCPVEDSPFTATIAGDLDALPAESLDPSRATLQGATFTSWSTTDRLSISDGTLYYTYQPTGIDGPHCQLALTGTGTGLDADIRQGAQFSVFYPQGAAESWHGTTVRARVYAEQDYQENAADGPMGPYMAAPATVSADRRSVHFAFQHTCSVIDVDVTGLTASRVSLMSNDGQSLAGRFDYNVATHAFSVVSNDATPYTWSTQSDVVCVARIPAGATVVRFYVLPVVHPHGLTLTVETTDGTYYTKRSSTALGTATTDFTMTGAGTVARPYYKKYNFGQSATARQNNWMATVPSNVFFAFLSTPGAHDAATSGVGGTNANTAKTQSDNIATQLAAGVRGFDLRPRYNAKNESDMSYDNLEIYHGSVATGVKMKDAVGTLLQFVKDNPTEAITITFVKENTKAILNLTDYSSNMWSVLDQIFGTDCAGYIHNGFEANLKLQAMRGKIIVVNRTGTTKSWATNITNWGDSETHTNYECQLGASTASNEDHYESTSHDEKKAYCSALLNLASANTSNTRYHFTFTNLAYSVFTSIASHAKAVNPEVTSLFTNLTGPAGYVFADYITDSGNGGVALRKAVIAQNNKYMYRGRSRYDAAAGASTGATVSGHEYADDGKVYAPRR